VGVLSTLFAVTWSGPAGSDSKAVEPIGTSAPSVGIIIDDLGDRLDWGRRALGLPGPVSYAFLPKTPYAVQLAELAHAQHKEIMLHVPMQAIRANRLGPGGLTLDMTKAQFLSTLRTDLGSVPHVAGVNNHMGSLLTRHPSQMGWFMEELRRRGDLFFVDSRTTGDSVAARVASESGVPNLQRDVFLDPKRDIDIIRRQFVKLLDQARHADRALGIGHPYPETLSVLEELLPALAPYGIRLLPVSRLLNRDQKEQRLWQASLSR
jgi:polysaccharide deacetylase 2 family uncharacterized protein YibQ